MAEAKRDQNRVTTLLAVSYVDGVTPVLIYADPVTHRLLVDTGAAAVSWNLAGNAGINPATNFIGTTDAQPLVFKTNNVEIFRVTAAGLIGIGTSTFDGTNPEKVLIDVGTTTSINAFVIKGTINNYLQGNIQNRSTGTAASSDFVATADNGNETTNFVDIGINGSGYTGGVMGSANDTYVYGMGNDMLVGAGQAGKNILFLAGGTDKAANMKMSINGTTGYINGRFSAPQGFLINGKIVTSVSAGNLTVAIKTLAGTDPSVSDPVHVRIGNTIRTITAALSKGIGSGINWFNLGSNELAGQEVDLFVYLSWNGTDVGLGYSRIPYGKTYGDFSTTNTDTRMLVTTHYGSILSTDEVEVVGRFNALLSSNYYWSIPNVSFNGQFENMPTFVAATTFPGVWVDGTASGSAINDAYGWSTAGSNSFAARFDNTQSHSGIGSLKVSTTGTNSYIEVKNDNSGYNTSTKYGIKLKPNTAYTINYWMKTNLISGSSTFGAYLDFVTANSAGTIVSEYNTTKVLTTTGWTQYTISFTTGATEVLGHFEARIYGHTGAANLIMDAWFDDITITSSTDELTGVVINRPIYETRWLSYTPVYSGASGSGATYNNIRTRYKIAGTETNLILRNILTAKGTLAGSFFISTPISVNNGSNIIMSGGIIPVGANITSTRGWCISGNGDATIQFVKLSQSAVVQWSDMVVSDEITVNGTYEIA